MTAEGQARCHLYWRLTQVSTGPKREVVCRLRGDIARKVAGDPSFASAHQPVRVAGLVYAKQGARRLVRILAQTDREADLEAFAESVERMPALPGLADAAPGKEGALPGAHDLLIRPVRQGGIDGTTRFEAITRVAGHWIRRARDCMLTLDQAWTEVRDYNETLIRSPWPEEKLRAEFDRLLRLDQRNHGAWPMVGPRAEESDDAAGGHDGTAPPPLSEDALAEAFTARQGEDWRYVGAWGAWLGRDGRCWRCDDTHHHLDLVRRLCRAAAAAADSPREARRLASQKTISAVAR